MRIKEHWVETNDKDFHLINIPYSFLPKNWEELVKKSDSKFFRPYGEYGLPQYSLERKYDHIQLIVEHEVEWLNYMGVYSKTINYFLSQMLIIEQMSILGIEPTGIPFAKVPSAARERFFNRISSLCEEDMDSVLHVYFDIVDKYRPSFK